MEKLTSAQRIISVNLLAAAAFTGCSVDSYLTDPSAVECDGKRTKTDLAGDGMATFVVRGDKKGQIATVKVRRDGNMASVSTDGALSGPPQQLETDGFTTPMPIVEGAELSAFGAGGAWVIDVRDDSVVIQGNCDGM